MLLRVRLSEAHRRPGRAGVHTFPLFLDRYRVVLVLRHSRVLPMPVVQVGRRECRWESVVTAALSPQTRGRQVERRRFGSVSHIKQMIVSSMQEVIGAW